MRMSIAALMTIGVVAAAGCSSTQVRTDFDPYSEFRQLRSYMWVERTFGSPSHPGVDSPLVERRVHNAVDGELVSRGYQKLTSGTPDFLIAYHVVASDRIEVQSDNSGYGYYGYPYGNSVYTYEYLKGTLILDIIDARDNKLIWRGWASKALDDDPKPEHVDMYVKKAVRKILKQFPPPA